MTTASFRSPAARRFRRLGFVAPAVIGVAALALQAGPASAAAWWAAKAPWGPKLTATIRLVGDQPDALAVSPRTGNVYVSTTGYQKSSQVLVLSGRTHKVIATIPSPLPQLADVAVSPLTGDVYVTTWGNGMLVISSKTNKVIGTVPGVTGLALAVSPKNGDVYVLTNNGYHPGTVQVVSGKTNELVTTIALPGSGDSQEIAVSPKTGDLYVTNPESDNVSVINGQTNSDIATITDNKGPVGIAVSPLTGDVYVGNTYPWGSTDSLSVINGKTNKLIATVPKVHADPESIAVSPLTGAVYATDNSTKFVSVINGRSNKVTANVPVIMSVFAVAVSPRTGQTYVTAANSDAVYVIAG